jgi:hypothetical protein
VIEKLERLAAARIQILPAAGIGRHVALERDGFVVLVERLESGFGRVGSAGLLTERGVAVLVWRGANAFFVAKGFEQAAEATQVQQLRSFSEDVRSALA